MDKTMAAIKPEMKRSKLKVSVRKLKELLSNGEY